MNWLGFAVLGMLFMGVGNFLMKFATGYGVSSMAAVVIEFTIMFLVAVTVFAIKRPELFHSLPGAFAAAAGGLFIGLGALFIVVAYGLPNSHGGIATAILNTNFAIVLILGFVVMHETITLKQGIGIVALLGGILLLI